MSTTEAKKIVRRYAKALKRARYPVTAVYLFGSHATGHPHKWSDIDVAVVSDKLRKNWDKNSSLLWKLRLDVDLRLEPHGFTRKEFADNANPLAYEVRKSGIRIV